jgi:hypothetical protein
LIPVETTSATRLKKYTTAEDVLQPKVWEAAEITENEVPIGTLAHDPRPPRIVTATILADGLFFYVRNYTLAGHMIKTGPEYPDRTDDPFVMDWPQLQEDVDFLTLVERNDAHRSLKAFQTWLFKQLSLFGAGGETIPWRSVTDMRSNPWLGDVWAKVNDRNTSARLAVDPEHTTRSLIGTALASFDAVERLATEVRALKARTQEVIGRHDSVIDIGVVTRNCQIDLWSHLNRTVVDFLRIRRDRPTCLSALPAQAAGTLIQKMSDSRPFEQQLQEHRQNRRKKNEAERRLREEQDSG